MNDDKGTLGKSVNPEEVSHMDNRAYCSAIVMYSLYKSDLKYFSGTAPPNSTWPYN